MGWPTECKHGNSIYCERCNEDRRVAARIAEELKKARKAKRKKAKKAPKPKIKATQKFFYTVKLELNAPMPDECLGNQEELGLLIAQSPIVRSAKVTTGRVTTRG